MREQLRLAVHRLVERSLACEVARGPMPHMHVRWSTEDRVEQAKLIGQHIGLVLAGIDGPLVYDWTGRGDVVPSGACVLNRPISWVQEQA